MFSAFFVCLASAEAQDSSGGIVGAPLSSPMDQTLQQTLNEVNVDRTKAFMKEVSPFPSAPAANKAPANNGGIFISPGTRFIVGSPGSATAPPASEKASPPSVKIKSTNAASPKSGTTDLHTRGKSDIRRIKLNFKDADARVVIDFIAKLYGLVPVITPELSQQITIYTPGEVPMDRAYAILTAVLNNLNYAVIRTDNFLKVVHKKDAPLYPLKIYYGNSPDMLPESDEMVTQLIPCKNISALEILKYIKPLVSSQSGENNVSADSDANLVIISDTASNIRRLIKLVGYLDVPGRHQFNDLITTIYTINYLKAKDLAACLTNAFNVKSAITVKNSNVVNNQIIIEPFLEGNALVVTARPDLQKAVAATIKKLDTRKRQVLLRVKFLEATYGRNFNFGADLVVKSNQFEKNGNDVYQNSVQSGPTANIDGKSFLTNSAAPQFAYIFHNNSVDFALQALLTKDNVKLLSQPRLLTADNEQASLQIGQKEPILKSTTTVSQNSNVVSDYSYIDVGITLSITPHINPEHDVSLTMDFKISEILNMVSMPGGASVPELSNRETKTTVTVKHGHTLIIGGIISKNHRNTQSSVPVLADIPVIGWLFGQDNEIRGQTELIILISPYVIDTAEDGDKVTLDEQKKLITRDKDFDDFKKYFIRKKEAKDTFDLSGGKIIDYMKGEYNLEKDEGPDEKATDENSKKGEL